MRSIRKISLLVAVAAAAIAVTAPAPASAAQLKVSGKLTPVGTQLTATSTNMKFSTSYGFLNCAEAVLHGKVIRNDGSVVEVAEVKPASARNCTINGKPMIVEPELKALKFEGVGIGTIGLAMRVQLPGLPEKCELQNDAGSVGYTSGGSGFSLTNVPMKGTSYCQPWLVSSDFLLTSPGGKVTLH